MNEMYVQAQLQTQGSKELDFGIEHYILNSHSFCLVCITTQDPVQSKVGSGVF